MRDRINKRTNETKKTGDIFLYYDSSFIKQIKYKRFSVVCCPRFIYIYIAEYLGVINN